VVALTAIGFAVSILVAPDTGATPTRGLTFLLFIGSSVHVASTGWLFTFGDVRRYAADHRFRYRFTPVGLVVIGATVAATMTPRHLELALLGYFGWQFFHYQKQNLGLAALAASSLRVASLTRVERRCMLTSGVIGSTGLLLRPDLLQLTHLGWHSVTAFHLATLSFAVSGLVGAGVLTRRTDRDRPAGLCVVYLMGLYFPLPIFVFASPYAAVGGMTIAHGAQYLVLVGMVARGPERPQRATLQLGAFAAGSLLLGLALNAASHLHTGGELARAGYGAYLGVVMSHFVIDAGLWRLRDPFPRQFLAERLPGIVRSPQKHSNVSVNGVGYPAWQRTTLVGSGATPAPRRSSCPALPKARSTATR
jgi:hypothetical protein